VSSKLLLLFVTHWLLSHDLAAITARYSYWSDLYL
jgi:hypothetical protein